MIKKGFSAKNKTDNDFIPAYFKLQKKLLREIETGRLDPGSSIPPERLLAETHKVSIGTVKRALLNLVNEGYLYRVQGSGTFVAGTNLRRENMRYYRFLENFRGKEANIKIQLFERVPIFISLERSYGLPTIFNRELFGAASADEEISNLLEIIEETPILLIEMLAYTYQEKPYEYRQSYCLTESKRVFREW